MKSTAIAAAILASVAAAQPHGHHRRHRHEDQLEKRALVVEWETVWETATVYVDEYTTETVLPSKTAEPEPTTSTGVPIQFFETPTTLATSTTAPTVEEVPVPTTTEVPPAPTSTYVPEPEPEPTTVDEPTTVEPPPVVETPTSAAPPPPPPAEETTTSTPPAAQPPVSPPESGSSNGSGGSGGGEGDITYFNVALGACGYDDTGADETENIVALPAGMWDAESTLTSYGINMPAHPWCDRIITIEAPNGNTADAKVRDRCPSCDGASIDVTPHAFKQLYGSLEVGRTEAKWWFKN
ncbi:hypothetical protein DL764_004526 [Monosporascus ibericus]|uniref:RlpA-like protein double-psi beta-barrel domain-containing protein n=1 Tax=Monosporascus ibericus TaxID=155417 RepID=A0A4Q4TGB9_9PEZI|nr:hypothetical protein DL764_004526 [Monosporascus ibericus]